MSRVSLWQGRFAAMQLLQVGRFASHLIFFQRQRSQTWDEAGPREAELGVCEPLGVMVDYGLVWRV